MNSGQYSTVLFVILFTLWLPPAPAMSEKPIAKKVYTSAGQKFSLEVLTQQDNVIWGFDFLDDGRILFSERSGALKLFNPKTNKVTSVPGAPKVWAEGQGGLLDVRIHPRQSNLVYLTYAQPKEEGGTTALGRGTLKEGKLQNFKNLFSAHKANDNEIHFGSRIEFDEKGHVFITVGDRGERPQAQDLSFHMGSVIRLKENGSVPEDNPFVSKKATQPEIWSFGHRNPQGFVRHPKTGDLWSAEMGPRGGDELNLIKKGENYGWPEVTYGREYYGPKIGVKTKPGTQQPVAYWVPSISPSGIAFYNGDKFPKWKGNLFLGTLSGQHLRRLVLEGNKVTQQEVLLDDLDLRFRCVRMGPDGFLYFSTDDGKIARLIPSR